MKDQMALLQEMASLPREVLGAMEQEMAQYRYLMLRPTAFADYAAFQAYGEIPFHGNRAMLKGLPASEGVPRLTAELRAAREGLHQVCDPEDVCWYIWGDSMPQEDGAAQYSYRGCADNPGFKPFLLPYLLDDPSKAKGNVICVAGGGFDQRANLGEGYPVAEYWRGLGYNAYVLQRRVKPFRPEDSMLDLQRAVRYLRYHGPQRGIGGLDCMVAIGFSGGSGTILGEVFRYYGHILPTAEYPGYVPDEIDRGNSDLDIVISHYGPSFNLMPGGFATDYHTENPHLPAIFMAGGEKDCLNVALPYLELYRFLFGKTTVELHLYADADHGYALGKTFAESEYRNEHQNTGTWMALADTFIELQRAKHHR